MVKRFRRKYSYQDTPDKTIQDFLKKVKEKYSDELIIGYESKKDKTSNRMDVIVTFVSADDEI